MSRPGRGPAPASGGRGEDRGAIDQVHLTPLKVVAGDRKPVGPSRSDRLMLYSLAFSWDLPAWFDDLDAIPMKSELDCWRWAFRAHGSRTLSHAQKDVIWTLFTKAQAKDGHGKPVGTAWPSNQNIANMTRTTRQTVIRAIDKAEKDGWLLRKSVKGKPSIVYFSLPKKLPAEVDRRSRRLLPTDTQVSPPTDRGVTPDGHLGVTPHGHKPTGVAHKPTKQSTQLEGFCSLASLTPETDQATKDMQLVEEAKVAVLLTSGQRVEVETQTAKKLIADGKAVAK